MTRVLKLVCVAFSLLLVSPIYANNGKGDVVKKESVNVVLVERNGTKSIVSEEEFSKASDYQKRMITMIDAAINALGTLNDENKIGIISISKNGSDNFSNSILIANKEHNNPDNEIVVYGSCRVCGMGSAMRCLDQLRKVDRDSFDVHVERDGGCVNLRW